MTPSAAVITVDIITTAVGTGTASYSGDNGQATSAGLDYPCGIRLDTAGNNGYLLFCISSFLLSNPYSH